MPDLQVRARVALGVAVVVVLVALTAARGPVVLLAAATVGLVLGAVVVLVPLLRSNPVDWDWHPSDRHEVPPEPGIATLHRLLAPTPADTSAPERLHRLVGAIAAERAPHGDQGSGALAAYLAAPPRRLGLDEVEAVVADLEAQIGPPHRRRPRD